MHFHFVTLLLASAAVSTSAWPILRRHHDSLEARELQYADIEAQSGPPDMEYWAEHYAAKEDRVSRHHPQHYRSRRDPQRDHHHHEEARHEQHHQWEDFNGEYEEFEQGHGPERRHHRDHHPAPRDDIVDNIIEFLSHEVRSVPDVSSHVVDDIKEFLSHHARDYHEHHHEHRDHRRHRHHERSMFERASDFFAWANR